MNSSGKKKISQRKTNLIIWNDRQESFPLDVVEDEDKFDVANAGGLDCAKVSALVRSSKPTFEFVLSVSERKVTLIGESHATLNEWW